MKGNVITRYLKNSFTELNKVTWPTKNQAVKLTAIVLALTFLFGVFLWVFDFLFAELFTFLRDI